MLSFPRYEALSMFILHISYKHTLTEKLRCLQSGLLPKGKLHQEERKEEFCVASVTEQRLKFGAAGGQVFPTLLYNFFFHYVRYLLRKEECL